MIPGIKNIINKKVKHREKFRPFAPAVCIENAESFFEMAKGTEHLANFMLGVYPVKNEYINIIPAAVHVDGTARVQTVSPTANPQFHSLLKTFEKLAGYPILLNTSFNVRGEPIVCCPYDSFRCMMGTEIDSLVMGNYLIERSNNYPHAWDSSDNAID
jgi:carbamoyltransferase